MMKVAILSDVHAAAAVYQAALDDARSIGFDVLVLLGDLLTYGPDPERTIEITEDAIATNETVLIQGNHDQIYLSTNVVPELSPDRWWISESIEWTSERIDRERFAKLGWRNEFIYGELVLAHANPYPFGDWTYLRSDDDFRSALAFMKTRGLRQGIFGHSHRHAMLETGDGMVTTVASLGQPRGGPSKAPQWAMATFADGKWQVEAHALDFDWRSHCESIQATSLSGATKDRLCEFFQ
jgi:predicted phosphodiesterase